MKIAVITGASSGLGREYVRQIALRFPELEKIVVIARRKERLEALKTEISAKVEPLALDLTQESAWKSYADYLSKIDADVRLLVNNSGLGVLGRFDKRDCEGQVRMVEVNVRAVVAMTNLTLAFMKEGSKIINISSIASFCPNPNMTVYSSTKAFISSFSRGLREELRQRRIHVLAVCPGPMDTEFLEVANIKGNSKMFRTLPYCKPSEVVERSLRASERNRAVYTNRFFFKFYRVLAKILPHALVVKMAKT